MQSPANTTGARLRSGRPDLRRTPLVLFAVLLAFCIAPIADAQSVALQTRALQRIAATEAIDAGPLPASTPLTLTLRLGLADQQRADLKQLLAAQVNPASLEYRHWLTPAQFGARFGASDDQLSALTAWLAIQGIEVTSVSSSRQRVVVRASASAAQTAFHVALRRYRVGPVEYFADSTAASLRLITGLTIESIAGLDDLPAPTASRVTIITGRGNAFVGEPRASLAVNSLASPIADNATDFPELFAQTIDDNQTPVLSLTTAACSQNVTPAEIDDLRALLDQAAAQGITVLAGSACASAPATSGSYPAELGGVLAYTETPRSSAAAPLGVDPRPTWQAAPGLPEDHLRKEPDLTASGIALVSTIQTLVSETGTRLGNINGILYALAATPDLYTQPDHAAIGTWEPATGLGTVNLQILLKAFPRIGLIGTSTSLVSDNYNVHYGQAFTLTAQVQPAAYGNTSPTGTVTFSSSTQGVLGATGIDGSGRATFTTGVLPVGPNSITATYQGDGNYSGSASNPPVGVYVSLVNASLTAVVSPSVNVPYGAIATVTATVTLPYLLASPSGPVTAQISSGAPSSATLSPNPGSNSASANIDLNVPPPGHYSVQVTCQGTTNFQCQTPANLPISVVKGYTNTSVSVTPASPQAGQPVSLTATVVNSGNGTGTYTYGGAITFFDSGRPIATVPVATNQATTQVSLAGNRTHNIIATYTGDPNWNTSTSNAVAVTPTILPDALVLSSNVSGSTSLAGVNVIFTGTVTTSVTYSSGPTGTLTFFDTFNGSVVQLGNPTALVPNGSAASIGRFTTTGLLPGVHSIYVQYSGDDNYAPATSSVLSLSMSDFSVTMTPPTLTLSQGSTAQVSALIGNSGGFSGTVSLGCTPPSSSEAVCSFSPAAITGTGSSVLTITTVAPGVKNASGTAPRAPGWTGGAAGIVLAGVLFCLPGLRRRVPTLLVLLLAAGLTGISGCGSGLTATSGSGSGDSGTSGQTDTGTPLGTGNYIITAAGSDGTNTVRRSFQYQVTVQ